MKSEKTSNTILYLLIVFTLLGCHKDTNLEQKLPIITNEEITTTPNNVSISWMVDFPGNILTSIEISQKEDLSDAHSIEGQKSQVFQNTVYSVVIDSLSPMTKYYYRQVVNTSYKRFEFEIKKFTTNKPTHSITLSSNPSNGGTVSGGGIYEEGQCCTAAAVVNAGFLFSNWVENDSVVSTDSIYSFEVRNHRVLVANFVRKPSTYTISVSASPSNGGEVSGGGTYQSGQACTLRATPAAGFTFVKWTIAGITASTEPVFTFNVTRTAYYVAVFSDNKSGKAP